VSLDRRLQRLEVAAQAAYWERLAGVLTERIGRPLSVEEVRVEVAAARARAAPYLAAGLSLPAAYAATWGVSEAEILAEAEAIAAAARGD
jgi:hypothetical protein